ncbi:hypothetical protein ACP_3276 [Acidobacterium capsulatum ATCC 51196]|uniref:Uncharacterized protein n=1 Tax=Acidobacterium capsulatum (strain ATCC 51196 / DSM 11244 / BCRC 80197 / JCM 7670 / NBRC 15755 / NCIMB 13165 / 161) TaxID=240015 RepID=C1F5U1_ACIC5|nr:hypothetical protein ACP_3276 [Acidobacterium capsulatum ATCC 51196]
MLPLEIIKPLLRSFLHTKTDAIILAGLFLSGNCI